jgi:thiol-disulfide isomerase/thioredoxin
VLVNFWTLTCINWLRQEPYISAWSQAYRNDGLVVIGVHTPEFSFEHDIARVRQATKDRAIDYPVAVDNDYEIWSAFANDYWPTLYFVDAEGLIRDHHFGEGRYERSERVIQRLLGVERQLVPVEGIGLEADADWDHLHTPETYLGYERTEHFASPAGAVFDDRGAYEVPERLRFNHWALAGERTIGREKVALDRAGRSIPCRDAKVRRIPGSGSAARAPEERAGRGSHVDVPAQAAEAALELARGVGHLHGSILGAVPQPPPNGRGRGAVDEFVVRSISIVGEEHTSSGRQAVAHQRPKRGEALERDMRQPEAEEHDVVAPVRAPREQVGEHEAHALISDSLAGESQHLRRRVDRGDRVRVTQQL